MDKYEFNIKVEQIKKLVNKGDYETAMKIADTIDWRRVRSTSLLTMVAQVYERNEEYQDAKDILLLAFERAPIGKGLLFKLTDLALREGNIPEAEAYYREFCDLSSEDPRQNLLRYLILDAKGAPIEQCINSLERYSQEELDEKWLYKLAELYHEAGSEDSCVKICDKIMLMFGLGKYVDKAMELKLQHAPLTDYQMDLVENREKYEEKLRAVEASYGNAPRNRVQEDDFDEADEIRDDDEDVKDEENLGFDEVDNEPVKAFEENLIVKLHEEDAEKDLAKEMSKYEPYDEEASSKEDETKILGDIRQIEEDTIVEDWDLDEEEAEEEITKNHLMIEAEDPQRGLNLALESLKKIHNELGSKNPVAKISGENLNKKGVFAVAERLAGKDLIIERAADLNVATLAELNGLMEQDVTGMVVVLIDSPSRMESLHNSNSGLADKFQYIGCDETTDAAEFFDEAAEEKRRLAEEERREAEYEAENAAKIQAEREADEIIRQEESKEELRHHKEDEDIRRQEEYEAGEEAETQEPEKHKQGDSHEMDVEEFAQYACKYASEIDCSISGKSMLALYERAEMMEEDGVPLTKDSAEELVEDAADKAEKRSFGGLFSSQYDKDGLLVLKEKHFFD